MGLFNLFGKPAGRTIRASFRPQLEPLGERVLPAILAGTSGIDTSQLAASGTVTVRTDGQNDVVRVTDTGSSSAGLSATFATRRFIRIGSGPTVIRDFLDARSSEVNQVLADARVRHLRIEDSGGSQDRNDVSYVATSSIPRLTAVTFVGSPGRDQFTANVNAGLNHAVPLRIVANGAGGDDTLTANLAGNLWMFSSLVIDVQGGLGADTILVNASTAALHVNTFARLSVTASGYLHGQDNNAQDLGNAVELRYRGDLDGGLDFDLHGSGGQDEVSAEMDFTSGSTGAVGVRNDLRRAQVRGGGGDDRVEYVVRGRLVTQHSPRLEGDNGADTHVYSTLFTPPITGDDDDLPDVRVP